MQSTKWPKAFLGIGITQISSRMFFTSIPMEMNYFAVSKDNLKWLSIMWNCMCCNYTGSAFCPTYHSSLHRLFCMAVGGATIPAVWIYCVLCSTPFRLLLCISIGFFSHHNTVGCWTGLIQCIAFNTRFVPLSPVFNLLAPELFF